MMIRNRVVCLGIVLGLAACSGGGDEGAGEGELAQQQDTAASAPADSAAANPDVSFLREMTDHHEGMIVLGMEAMNRAQDDSVKTAAHMLHQKQQMERDSMVAMMQTVYGQQHQPMIMPKHQAQADSLRQMTGPAVDRYFLQATIAHHQEGVQMLDRTMPQLTNPQLRQMAEKMKTDHDREIAELQGKLSTL
jgi:uncharacterized protein (DUF305 family)